MKLSKLLGVTLLCILLVPFVLGQGEEPKDTTVSQMLNKYRKQASSNNVEERRKAFEGFYGFSRNVSHVVDNLQTGLQDPDEEIRNKAAMAIANIGPSAKRTWPLLVGMLEKEKESGMRIRATIALGSIFFESRLDASDNNAIVALARALREDPSLLVRCQVCRSLRNIGPGAKDAMGDLIDTMLKKQSDETLNEMAVEAFSSVAGPECSEYAPRLLDVYRKGAIDESMRFSILSALGKIGAREDQVIPLLVSVMKSKDVDGKRLRSAAAFGLCEMGPKAKDAVPAITEALEGSFKENDNHSLILRRTIIEGLPKFGPDAKSAVPTLIGALERTLKEKEKEDQSSIRYLITDCFRRMGPNAILALPSLRKIVADPQISSSTRKMVSQAIKAIEGPMN